MSAAWRIFRKDLRRFWLLGVAAALIAVLLAFFPALATGGSTRSIVSAAGSLHWMVLGVTALVLVQDDLVVSDRADWITRPFGTGSVLAAKLLFIATVLILPFGVISFLSASQYGLGGRVCALVTFDAAAKVTVGVLFFAFVAAATPSFLGAILAFAGLAAAQIFLEVYLNLLVDNSGTLRLESLHPSSLIVAAVLVLGLLGLLYRWRQPRWSAAGMILACGALLALEHHLSQVLSPLAETSAISASPKNGAGFIGASLTRPYPLPDGLVVGLEIVKTQPPGQDGRLWPLRVAFQPEGASPFAQKIPSGASIRNPEPDAKIYTAWSSYAGTARTVFGVVLQPYDSGSLVPVMALSGSEFERMKGRSGPLTLTLQASRSFAQSRDEVPLEAGASLALPGSRISLQAVRTTGGPGIEVATRRTFLNSSRTSEAWPVWALVNHRTGEVSLQEFDPGQDTIIQSYLLYDWRQGMLFAHRWRPGSDRIEAGVDASWLQDARLICVGLGSERLGSVQLSVPRFTLPRVGGID